MSSIIWPVLRANAFVHCAAAFAQRTKSDLYATVSANALDAYAYTATVANANDAYAAAVNAIAAAANATYTLNAAAAAAAAVGAASATDAYAIATDTIWMAVELDLTALDDGILPEILVGSSLWPDDLQQMFILEWRELSRALKKRDEGWEVWTDWYEDRLAGRATAGLPEKIAQELDLKIALQPDEWWQQGPAIGNTDIKQWVAEAKEKAGAQTDQSSIPPTQPATIRPVWDGQFLGLPNAPLENDLGLGKGAEMFRALKQEIDDFTAKAAKSNVDQRAVEMLKDVGDLIPESEPDNALLFRIVRRELQLQDYTSSVDAEWPHVLAADYRAICLMLTKALDQFPDRRLFERNATKSEIEASSADDVRADIIAFATALERDGGEFVDQAVPAAFRELAAITEPDKLPVPASGTSLVHISHDQLESVGNTLKEIAAKSMQVPAKQHEGLGPLTSELVEEGKKAYQDGFQETYVEASRKAGMQDAEKAAFFANRALHGQSTIHDFAQKLADKYPRLLGWVKKFLGTV